MTKNKDIIKGVVTGAIAGVFNFLPLLFSKDVEIIVYISTMLIWSITGFFIVTSNINLPGIVKGIIISFMISLPTLIYVFSASIMGAVWTLIWTLIFGAVIGFILKNNLKENRK